MEKKWGRRWGIPRLFFLLKVAVRRV